MTASVRPAMDVPTPAKFGFLYNPPRGAVRYRVAYGGRGSAKSWQFARALLIHGMSDPMRILCAREYQSSFRESVMQLLTDQIAALRLGGFYRVRATGITGRNGTEFLFKGIKKDIKQIKSTEAIDICWVEEAESVSDESWRVLIPTIRKDRSEIWVTFNPALETDPTYKRFVVDPPSRAIVEFVGYWDNPWLPAVLLEEAMELKRKDLPAFDHVWGGEPWRRSEAEVLSGKWRVEEFTPTEGAEGWGHPLYGGDFGFANDPAMAVRLWTRDKRLWMSDEAGGIRLDMDALARAWARIPGLARHTVRADSSRPETINELRRRKLNIIAAPKWPGSVEDGIEHLRSYEEIIIHPQCVVAQREARMWRYKTDPRTGDVLPKLLKGNEHTWDASRYALSPLIRRGSRPRFTVIGAGGEADTETSEEG